MASSTESSTESEASESGVSPHDTTANPQTTADKLYNAVGLDMWPEDPSVLADFGFHRFFSDQDKWSLLALYRELLVIGVPSKDLHQWRTQGSLVENIANVFAKQSPDTLGPQYCWFMRNKAFLDQRNSEGTAYRASIFKTVRQYLTPEDRAKRSSDLPRSKRECLKLYAVLSHGTHPSKDDEYWHKFGFCVCTTAKEQDQLATLYRRLIFGARYDESWQSLREDLPPTSNQSCTFAEFAAAYDDVSLAKLLRSKAVVKEPHEEAILAHLDGHFIERTLSLQRLATFLAMGEKESPPADMMNSLVHFGFGGSHSSNDLTTLKLMCRILLEKLDASTLYHVAMQGKFREFTSGEVAFGPFLAEMLELST